MKTPHIHWMGFLLASVVLAQNPDSGELGAAAVVPKLVKDINTTPANSRCGNAVVFKDAAYFAVRHDTKGCELWKSDGTEAGTVLVRDIWPGAGSSNPDHLTVFGNRLFFTASNSPKGNELWSSDGTTAGTRLFRDHVPGKRGSSPEALVAAGDGLFFRIGLRNDLRFFGSELWRTDGTAAGTRRIRPIDDCSNQHQAVGANLFFFDAGTGSGCELWRSDGTVAGTFALTDLHARRSLGRLDVFGDSLIFATHGAIWKSDGTKAGTVPFAEPYDPIHYFAASSSIAVFDSFSDGASEFQGIWRTDGTAEGTLPLEPLDNGFGILERDSTFYISARTLETGFELFRSDGTSAGTALLADLNPGPAHSFAEPYAALAGGRVLFEGVDADGRKGLWSVAAPSAGAGEPILLQDFGQLTLGPLGLSDRVLFWGDDRTHGEELWSTDGTVAGTRMVLALSAATQDAAYGPSVIGGSPHGQVVVTASGLAFFKARSAGHGEELWRSDGTPQGTFLVKDIAPGTLDSSPDQLTAVGSTLYFTAYLPGSGTELWSTDGTTAGTRLLPDLPPSSSPFRFGMLTARGKQLFFAVNHELWKTDGTAAGTVVVTSFGADPSPPGPAVNIGSTLYFPANGPGGRELWRSDGTSAGTWQVKDIHRGAASSAPLDLTVVGHTLYFFATDGVHGRELWSSDGTEIGTNLVRDIVPGPNPSRPYPGVTGRAGSLFYFDARTAQTGSELWRTDGTTEGTTLVRDVRPGGEGSDPQPLGALGSTLYFAARTKEHGHELWRTDGTAGGTVLVRDIQPGIIGSSISNASVIDGALYFSADDGSRGAEPWVVRRSGVVSRLSDLAAGVTSSLPSRFAAGIEEIFFLADDGKYGRELWTIPR